MDNKDFDKIFSDSLGEEQEFDFRESDWDEVAAFLSTKPKRRLFWWIWLIPILFLMFGGVVYSLLTELEATKKEVLELNEKLSVSQIEKADTFFNKTTITVIDTIYKTVVKENVITKNVYLINPKNENDDSEFNLNKKSISTRADTNVSNSYENIEKPLPIILLSQIPLRKVDIELEPEDEHFYLKETQFPEKKRGVKDRLKLGLTNAWAVTENYSAIDSMLSLNSFPKKIMLDVGLKAEWAFSKRISANAAISIAHVSYKSMDKIEDKLAVNEQSLPDAGGTLINGKMTQSHLNYQLGVKYLMGTYKKWIPYIGMNVEAQSTLTQKAKNSYYYAYQERNTKTARYNKPGFEINALTLFGGYEKRFAGQFSWQVEGWHRFNFNNLGDQIYARFGIRNSVLYHF